MPRSNPTRGNFWLLYFLLSLKKAYNANISNFVCDNLQNLQEDINNL